MKWVNRLVLVVLVTFAIAGCRETKKPDTPVAPPKVQLERPAFSADSAYAFIQKQVDFGPRVPGTEAHKACAVWMENKLKSYGMEVVVQTGQVSRFDGVKLPMYNVIGSINPAARKRILLCAHWDTRFVADQDVKDRDEPIDGANDGGSGVGVLLEIARQFQLKQPEIGVDIILFDVEDQGQPDGLPYKPDTYCLGSQYWAKQPHKPNYSADAGILLDMVGARGSVFTLEGTSMQYAASWMREVWDLAIQLGHSSYFSYERTDPIVDDHLYINRIRQIPTIDIIQFDYSTRTGFGAYWHTHDDNMDIIDKDVLQAVGETTLAAVYTFD